MFRMLMILANVAALVWVILIVAANSLHRAAAEWAGISAISVFLMLNIILLLPTATNKSSWLALRFKRKRLEEKKKIEALQLDDSSTIADELVAEGAS